MDKQTCIDKLNQAIKDNEARLKEIYKSEDKTQISRLVGESNAQMRTELNAIQEEFKRTNPVS